MLKISYWILKHRVSKFFFKNNLFGSFLSLLYFLFVIFNMFQVKPQIIEFTKGNNIQKNLYLYPLVVSLTYGIIKFMNSSSLNFIISIVYPISKNNIFLIALTVYFLDSTLFLFINVLLITHSYWKIISVIDLLNCVILLFSMALIVSQIKFLIASKRNKKILILLFFSCFNIFFIAIYRISIPISIILLVIHNYFLTFFYFDNYFFSFNRLKTKGYVK